MNKVALAGVVLLFLCGCAFDPVVISNIGYEIDTSNNKLTSLKELNEQNVIMQEYDFSCGAASLATLMRHYFADDVSEQDLLDQVKGMFSPEEYDIIADRGLSFLELGKVSQARGYQSASVKLKPQALSALKGPILVYVETTEYKHFAILRGVIGNRVFLADPSRGNVRLSMHEFSKEWRGEAFVLGRRGFGVPVEHQLAILPMDNFRNENDVIAQMLYADTPSQSTLLGAMFDE